MAYPRLDQQGEGEGEGAVVLVFLVPTPLHSEEIETKG